MAASMKRRITFMVAYFGRYHYIIPTTKESGKASA